MDTVTKPTKMYYLECSKGELHAGEQLNFVCVEPSCKDCGLICSICRINSHSTHRVLPLKMFLNDLATKFKQRTNSSQLQNVDEMLAELDNKTQSIFFNLKEIVENLAATIKQFEAECVNTVKRVRDRIVSQAFMSDNMQQIIDAILNGEYTDAEVLGAECKKLVESVVFSEAKGVEIDIRPGKSLDAFAVIESDIVKTLQKTSKTFIESIKKIEKSFDKPITTNSISKAIYAFDQAHSSSTITIHDGKLAVQNTSQNYENRFALVTQELSADAPSRFAFAVKQIAGWVGFGICIKSVLKKKAYKFDHGNIGHGSYLISSNGYSWSHSSKEDNIAVKSFSFALNDIIVCEYDPTKKTLTFKKHKTQNRFTLAVQIPEGEKVFPCVNLCSKDDQAEIVNNIDLAAEEF